MQHSRWIWVAAILLWLLFAQTLGAARAASITFDEGPHLAVGYATLRSGDLRLQPIHIHPPLANMLAAAPLLLSPDLPDPRQIFGWEISSLSAVTDAIVWQYPHPARLALAGRLPIILLTLLTGALVFRWAADFGGARAGALALGLFVLDSNIIAHGSLITTDMALTAFALLTFFLLHRLVRRRSHARLVGVGLALGAALACKVSAVLLLLLVAVVLASKDHRRGFRLRTRTQSWQQSALAWLVIALIALFVLWAVYGFELRTVPEFNPSLPFPAATHLDIYRSLQTHYRLGHPAFLIGQNSDQGWWYYFPVAFLVKTPLPVLILLGSALFAFFRGRRFTDLTLTLFPLVYTATFLFSTVDIGYRHLLPILPFVYIFISAQLRFPASPNFRFLHLRYAIILGLALWLVVGTVLVYPYPLTFFNELADGPTGGYRWLVDSNLDWGQNLWQLRDWMRSEDLTHVYYSHFSPARTEVYDVTADRLPPAPHAIPFAPLDPAPGVYAIGATTLQGVYVPNVNTFAYFRTHEPDAVLGHALFIYRVPEHPKPSWAAICFDLPLSDRQIRAGFGQPDLRLIFYDCAQSYVFPIGGEGRYMLPAEADWPKGTALVLHARHADGSSIYNILEPGEPPSPDREVGSVTVEGPLTFLGYDLSGTSVRPGGEIILQTHWRVEQNPNRPLSLMAHLLGAGEIPIAVGDGLGIPVEQWKPGDILVQRHSFLVPEGVSPGEYRFQTGAYWLDTQERWSFRLQDGTSSDHLLLDKITILD